jgi:ankyrin repeat protein
VEELKQPSHIAPLARVNKPLYNVVDPYLFNVNQQGISAVNWAACKGNSHVIKSFILIYEVNVNVRDEDGRTPIFNAIDSQDEATVKILLEQKSIDSCMYTPLNLAVKQKYGYGGYSSGKFAHCTCVAG